MKIAGIQMDVTLGKVSLNLNRMIEKLRIAAAEGARLIVFPECALTGYCFENIAEARPFAESLPGPATQRFGEVCRELDVYVVFGLLELDSHDGVFNATALVGPDGLIGAYRKVHLPYLGVDMYSSFGDRPFAVHDAGELKVGMNICYDASFPEGARTLALLGADLIALPTNWPPGAENTAAYTINARAQENGVYYIAVNRVGVERGFAFVGSSRICDPFGSTLASADHREEAMIYAEIDIARARNKRFERETGKHAIDRLADRRPEMYRSVIEPHQLTRPGRGE
ncbi:MAG: carbon-nitrogen hydrolase family protein [Planctomycetota bacterium]|nr:carbon-nitrogen hydrolase family protein [Planctomycetota bacterium]